MALKDSIGECLPNPDPLERPDYTEADAQALRAVRQGTATEEQQKRAWGWLIFATGLHDQSFRRESERLGVFAEGKRFIGLTLVWMLQSAPTKTDPDKIATRHIEG